MSNAPRNPAHVEVDDPTQPYSRAEIDRLRQVAKSSPQDERLDADDQGMEGWFQLDGRWLRVCLRSFEHFGFSGAPPGMMGAVDASFVSGTIGEGSAALHPGPQFPLRLHKWRLWALVAAALALALAAWVGVRFGTTPVQPTTRDAEQVKVDVPGQPVEFEPTVPIEAPAIPSPKPDEVITLEDEPPNKEKPRKDFDPCVEHRKSAMTAKDGADWELLLKLARRHNCWSRPSKAKALQMEALFELGRFLECVQLGAQGGSKEMQQWAKTCQLNL